MNFYRSTLIAFLGAATVCLLFASAQSEMSLPESSASIRASAAVVNPIGMTSTVREIGLEQGADPAASKDNLHQQLADVILIHTPSESLMLLFLETGGKTVARFELSGQSLPSESMDGLGVERSGLLALSERAIRAVLPSDDSRCVLTLIDPGY